MHSLERLRAILTEFWSRISRRREASPAVRLPKIRAERQVLRPQYLALKPRDRRRSDVWKRLNELLIEEFKIGNQK